DVGVASAPTQVAFQTFADLRFGRPGRGLQQGRGSHEKAWRTEPALQAVLIPERLLERRQRPVGRQTFDRGDASTVDLDCEQGARLDGPIVEEDRARPALAGVATDVRTRQPQLLTQKVDEEVARLDLPDIRRPVDV